MVPIQCQPNGAEHGVRPGTALHSPQQNGIFPARLLAGEQEWTPCLARHGTYMAAVPCPVGQVGVFSLPGALLTVLQQELFLWPQAEARRWP